MVIYEKQMPILTIVYDFIIGIGIHNVGIILLFHNIRLTTKQSEKK